MEEVIKYLESLEARLSAMEDMKEKMSALETELKTQSDKTAAQTAHINELQTLVGALSAKLALAESRLAELQTAAESLKAAEAVKPLETPVPEPVQQPVPEPQPEAPSVAESDVVAVDEETGLPELEVELVEEPENNEAAEAPAEPEIPTETKEPEDAAPKAAEPVSEASKPAPAPTIADAAQQANTTVSSVVPKIEDLKKAISVGDRFLFQRELFGGNGEVMNKTIASLNELPSLADAEEFIAKQFPDWNKESNGYELFTNLLKRRW